MRKSTFALGAALGLAFVTSNTLAQSNLNHPIGEDWFYSLDSGVVANLSDEFQVVFTDLVQVNDSAWLRLYFSDINLENGSYIRITSVKDGETQELTAKDLALWSYTSGYFNGDAVFFDIIAAPNTFNNRVKLDHVTVEYPKQDPAELCGICGTDERYQSYEDFAGRQMPVGCTATIWNENGCMVSAGHCAGSGQVVEFNVPNSNSNCTLNHPPIADQFPITNYKYRNGGVGADWEVIVSGDNNLGENAYQHMGALKRIASTPANTNDPIDVWGYAIDNDCTLTQVQQHSPNGKVTYRSSTHYEYNADITFGNSGSSIIHANEIIGIVTHCSYGCPNYGTRVDNSDFAAARDDLCPGGAADLTVYAPVPGLAGQNNSINVAGCTPYETSWVVWGRISGSTGVPGCPGVNVGINNPKIAGSDVANGSGDAVVSSFVPNAAHGVSVIIQAVEVASCRVSNIVYFTFP